MEPRGCVPRERGSLLVLGGLMIRGRPAFVSRWQALKLRQNLEADSRLCLAQFDGNRCFASLTLRPNHVCRLCFGLFMVAHQRRQQSLELGK